MNFEFSEQQEAIREAIAKICSQFGDDYWLARDQDGHFPDEFVKAVTEGWLGIAMPEAYGGQDSVLPRRRSWRIRLRGPAPAYERRILGAFKPFRP